MENCCEHWQWGREGARTFFVLVLRFQEKGGWEEEIEVLVWWDYKCYCSPSFPSSLCLSLLSFLRSHCRTQALPCIINVSKPHLTPNNKTASRCCTGQCEAQQTSADWDSVSKVGQGAFLSWTLSSYSLRPVLDDMAGGHFWIMQSSLQSGTMSSN